MGLVPCLLLPLLFMGGVAVADVLFALVSWQLNWACTKIEANENQYPAEDVVVKYRGIYQDQCSDASDKSCEIGPFITRRCKLF